MDEWDPATTMRARRVFVCIGIYVPTFKKTVDRSVLSSFPRTALLRLVHTSILDP